MLVFDILLSSVLILYIVNFSNISKEGMQIKHMVISNFIEDKRNTCVWMQTRMSIELFLLGAYEFDVSQATLFYVSYVRLVG